jgi:hypothetical protein
VQGVALDQAGPVPGDEEPPRHPEGGPDGVDRRPRLVGPDDGHLGDAVAQRPRHREEFDVPREPRFVEVVPDPRPRLGGQRLGATLVVGEVDVQQSAREPGEAVAEVAPGDRLVRADVGVGVAPRPDRQVRLAGGHPRDDVGDGAGRRGAVGVRERQDVGVERLEPGRDGGAFPPATVGDPDLDGEGGEAVDHAPAGSVEFDADRLRVECVPERPNEVDEAVDVRPVGREDEPDGTRHRYHGGSHGPKFLWFRPRRAATGRPPPGRSSPPERSRVARSRLGVTGGRPRRRGGGDSLGGDERRDEGDETHEADEAERRQGHEDPVVGDGRRRDDGADGEEPEDREEQSEPAGDSPQAGRVGRRPVGAVGHVTHCGEPRTYPFRAAAGLPDSDGRDAGPGRRGTPAATEAQDV